MELATQHGGLDKYVENTRADLLGYEGMRLRLMIREKIHGGKRKRNGTSNAAPTILDATRTRMQAGKALGLPGPATCVSALLKSHLTSRTRHYF